MAALASFSPTASTCAPGRRNFSTTLSSADVAQVRLRQVEGDARRRVRMVERGDEAVGRGEEQLPADAAGVAAIGALGPGDISMRPTLRAKKSADSSTPRARSWVATVTAMAAGTTRLDRCGCVRSCMGRSRQAGLALPRACVRRACGAMEAALQMPTCATWRDTVRRPLRPFAAAWHARPAHAAERGVPLPETMRLTISSLFARKMQRSDCATWSAGE